ncbi:MAG: DNA polymerase III subunit beta [Acidimicrobiaceae bacterium]|nr:DNA polymerase III subunit beta [Acidimicrobiaceae bacterium]
MSMKFRCERDVLSEALGTAGRGVAARAGAAMIGGVRLELAGDQLTATGSDGDLTISVTVTVSGSGDGSTVMRSKLMGDVVRSLRPGAVDVLIEGEDARIVANPSEFSIRVAAVDEFPEIPEPSGDVVTLDAAMFRAAIDQVSKAASTDDARPILTGVLMAAESDGLRLVSTDSYRLAMCDIAGLAVLGEGQKVLVPSRALKELARVVGDEKEITLSLGEHNACFSVGRATVTTRLIEGDFPNYSRLIPDTHENRLTIDREKLLDSLRRVRLLAQESTPIRIAMSADGLEVAAVAQEVGEARESLEAHYEGDDLMVAFNPEYLIDGIEVSPGSQVVLETIGELKPALLKSSEDPNFLYLLMPVRVS